ncbi:MAG: hypothetical protein ACYCZY_02115 [Lacisediminihabitans sp.]
MSDDLFVSGGGSTAVATAGLFAQQQQLRSLSRVLAECLLRLVATDRVVTGSHLRAADAPLRAARADRSIDDAYAAMRSAGERADVLASALDFAAKAYGEGEQFAQRLSQELSARLAYELGSWLPLLGFVAAPVIVGVGAGLAVGYATTPATRRDEAITGALQSNKWVLSDPRFVELVRLAVTSSDDFGGGLFRVPAVIVQLLGDEGLGLLGLGSSAAAVLALSRSAGVLRETPVLVTPTGTTTGSSPPANYEERAKRIPSGESQIRIERYAEEDRPDRFEVYLGGTIDASVVARDQPWDMTSNVTAIAGGEAGSYLATRQAMELAGIDSSTPVVFNGYSQGGLLAALLVSSGDYDARGLFTLGAPAGQVEVPHDVPYVAVEHSNDLVPAVGGVWKSSDPVLVRRELFDGRPDGTDKYLPAHELSNYRDTAKLMDCFGERGLADVSNAFAEFGAGNVSVQTTFYRARRVAEG